MDGTAGGTPERTPAIGPAFVVYSLLRLLLFAVLTAALLLVGLRGLPLIGTAVILSAISSFFVLRPQREALARAIAGRDERRQDEKADLRSQLDEKDHADGGRTAAPRDEDH